MGVENATLGHVFTLRMKHTAAKLRLLSSASARHMSMPVKR